MISPTQRPLPDNTRHSQETGIHAAGGIRTHNPSKRAAADPSLRSRGHWDRLSSVVTIQNAILPKCSQQDITLLNLFISIKRSTCFRRFLRPSSGAQTVHTASGICQTLPLTAAIIVGMELVWMPIGTGSEIRSICQNTNI
jgi:hypothetical protein